MDALVRLCIDGGDDLAAAHWLERCTSLRLEHAGPDGPEAGRCWWLRGRLRAAEGRWRSALDSWQRALPCLSEADRPAVHLDMGRAALELGQDADAEAYLARARDAGEPAVACDALAALARLWSGQGQHERAMATMREQAGMVQQIHGPDSAAAADSLILLAGLCEAAGDIESAASAMERAVEVLGRVLGPDDEETAMAAAWLLALHSRLAGAPDVPPER
ncbi:MAG: hypothetical protein D6798_03445 [Deltaproteobacteria bacterium]|nr:MAG: hypothetical protein D6798_03445 [Deltaproteobacteria bacterium]